LETHPGRVGDQQPVIKYREEYGDENSGSGTPVVQTRIPPCKRIHAGYT
jgi:hypothetical protein